MKFLKSGKAMRAIEVDRELSDLDRFALGFIDILGKHGIKYVVVSGYVSILLGRARASEDIDVIIPRMKLDEIRPFLESLVNGYCCLNEDGAEEIFGLMEEDVAARFARKGTVIPNIELKFSKTRADGISLRDRVAVKLRNRMIYISPLEMQVAFKEAVLCSPKDIEDARHLRNVAKGYIDLNLVKRYEAMLHEIYGTK
ncbi:MAG: hypothetical protein V1813_02325 [Candidatus Aenigmatarchaeota archaeon]